MEAELKAWARKLLCGGKNVILLQNPSDKRYHATCYESSDTCPFGDKGRERCQIFKWRSEAGTIKCTECGEAEPFPEEWTQENPDDVAALKDSFLCQKCWEKEAQEKCYRRGMAELS